MIKHCEEEERLSLAPSDRLRQKLREISGRRFWFRNVTIIEFALAETGQDMTLAQGYT
jgi:hypothetical protein